MLYHGLIPLSKWISPLFYRFFPNPLTFCVIYSTIYKNGHHLKEVIMKLYIIRHADPNYETDTITEFGQKEANALADHLKDVKIDKIYTSPFGRAIATAMPTCTVKGLEPEILPWIAENPEFLRSADLDRGDTCTYKFSVEKGIHDFVDFKKDSRAETIERLIKNSDEFLSSHGYTREGALYRVEKGNDESIAVFCHCGSGTAWIGHLIGLSPGLSFVPLHIGTTSVSTIEFSNGDREYIRPRLTSLGDITHIHKAGLKVNNL